MQKVLDFKVLSRAAMPLMALTGISLGIAPESVGGNIIEAAMFVAGMIGIAAVMRADVADLKKWKMNHEDSHKQIADANVALAKILGRLEEAKNDSDRRLNRIERQVYSRRAGDVEDEE
jgi:hypothetical protein